MWSRRGLIGLAAGAAALGCEQVAAAWRRPAVAGPTPREELAMTRTTQMLTRPHPRTGEALPVIGLGTWQTFDVGPSAAERAPIGEVLRTFAAAGGRVIDTSPMYGRAEQVSGDMVAETGVPKSPFWATKVWTRGQAAGAVQIDRSLQRLRTERIDLLQVHNLLDFEAHIGTLRQLRAEGRVRYLGATHYTLDALPELERVLREEQLDFVQLPYSVMVRAAEARLLPAAAELGVAVLVMRPFEGGELFARVRGRPLPPWAQELGCTSAGQLFLKFILGHPAVHCPLPATRSAKHMADNLQAGFGRMPTAEERRKIIDWVAG